MISRSRNNADLRGSQNPCIGLDVNRTLSPVVVIDHIVLRSIDL